VDQGVDEYLTANTVETCWRSAPLNFGNPPEGEDDDLENPVPRVQSSYGMLRIPSSSTLPDSEAYATVPVRGTPRDPRGEVGRVQALAGPQLLRGVREAPGAQALQDALGVIGGQGPL
jgi:hypothetical protein